MTRSELLNYFISQVTMSWPESEMETTADVSDVQHMMMLLTILLKAFQQVEGR
jgi:hypothetical protein